jgi:CheY-like chemotaxis protein
MKQVIMIDDDDTDRMLAARTFKISGLEGGFLTLASGQEGIAHLISRKEAQEPLPDLLLLDINMPEMSGFDVLKVLRQDEAFRSLKIWIFSNSKYDEDRTKALDLGADDFHSKPSDLKAYREFFTAIFAP